MDVRLKIQSGDLGNNVRIITPPASKPSGIMAMKDRRNNKERVVENIEKLLNQHQLSALHDIESSGWRVFCVRTSLFQNTVVVVVNSEGDVFATLEYDGELNLTPHLSFRKDDLRV